MALRAQCENALFTWRFLTALSALNVPARPVVAEKAATWQYNHCRHQMSLTGNTIFANTKLPLTKWFLANAPVVTNQNRLVSDGAKAPVGRQI